MPYRTWITMTFLTHVIFRYHLPLRSARDAIRWLERELERGHKGIRAQERAEVGSLPWPAPTRRQEGRSRYEVREYTAFGTLLAVLRIRI